MNIETAIELFRQAVTNSLMLVTPILGTTIIVGLLISIIQSVTSIQEQTLSFAPKLFAVGGVLIIGSAWIIRTLMSFTTEVYQKIPEVAF